MRSRVRNRTGRVRITHESAPVVHEEGTKVIEVGPFRDLGGWLPKIPEADQADAIVVVDISCSMFLSRKTLGSLKAVTTGSWDGATIDIPPTALAGTSFEVEIAVVHAVDGGSGGRILARVEPRRFRFGHGGEDESLLGVAPRDLGDEVWRIEFPDDHSGPQIVFNSRIGNWATIARQDIFRATAMQRIFHRVYSHIAFNDVGEPWMEVWMDPPGCSLPDRPPRPAEGDTGEAFIEFHEQCESWAVDVAKLRASNLGVIGNMTSLREIIEQAELNNSEGDADVS